jgi:quinoprotein glucose dehydrogenase
MNVRWLTTLAAGVLIPAAWAQVGPVTPTATRPGDWPMYNRDLAGTRHSPLTQITPANVSRLTRAWTFKMGPDPTAGSITGGSEYTPLVVGGVMYVNTAKAVHALDAATGTPIWRHEMETGSPSKRGVTYWPGSGDVAPRVFFTAGRRLVALEAEIGRRAEGFGKNGEVDMGQTYSGSPTLYKAMLVVGTNSAPGGVRAFDTRTGAKVWEFVSIPQQPGARGQDTWLNGSWKGHSGAISWAFSTTIDASRNTVYAVFDSPIPDYYGGDRHGDNLFANAIVALDADRGTYKWHFQTTHHDLWDYDIPQPPVLHDVNINGRAVPVLTLAHKTGWMYILDRETGKPVFGIEERPVPASDVPGEKASPTQPIPVKPPAIARVSYTPDDIVTAADTTAEHAAFCRGLVERSGGLHNAGPFTPYLHRAPGAPPRSTILFPGSVGGANWGGSASDPSLGYVFVNTMDEASIGWIENRAGRGSASGYNRNSIVGPTSRFQWFDGDPASGNILNSGERGWPCQKPPWGNLVAVNVSTGDIAWRVPLGITEELPPARQRTGRLNMGGPITTASGLVFIGASNDHRFRAFDARTGKELWVSPRLAMSAHAVPVTYLGRNGKQYVGVVAAGQSALDDKGPVGGEELVAYALP